MNKKINITPTVKEMTKLKPFEPVPQKIKKYEDTTFILDKNKIFLKKDFTFCKMPNNKLGIGMLLPKIIERTDNKGKIILRTQEDKPAMLCEDGDIIDISNPSKLESLKIKFGEIPTNMNLRWDLDEIKRFLDGDIKTIEKYNLFLDIRGQYSDFMYFGNEVWYDIHALWDISTYFFMLFDYFPILELRGHSGTAKTKIMDISKNITFNATDVMVDPSESTLFRETHSKRPSKYIDEAEKLFKRTKFGIESDNRAEVINSSYKKGSKVPRQEKLGNKFYTVWYDTYSPTMIGSINGLYGATEDRAIIHITTKNPDTDHRGEIEPDENHKSWQEIRNKLYLFTFQNWKAIKNLYRELELVDIKGLKKRQFKIWLPVLTIAKFIDEKVYDRVLEFAIKLTTIKSLNYISEGSFEYKLCKTVKEILQESDEVLISQIIDKAFSGEERKPTPQRIGKSLDKLGFFECRKHFREGNGFLISLDLFENILSPLIPSLFTSLSSLSSEQPNLDNTIKISEEVVKKDEDNCEVNDEIEVNEANTVKGGIKK
jgi:hypothetical protein